jgi:nucleotide-binding universal stress UspA family protein
MLQRILVPTDGSVLAERSFPLAERIATCQGAAVVVARVVPPITWAGYDPAAYGSAQAFQAMFDAVDEDCQRYLDRVAERFRAAGIAVTTEMLRGSPIAGLLNLEEKLTPDLVIMGTHGRSGLARFALGSVADLMVRYGTSPVLLVRSFAPALSGLRTALVPLDGSPLAEEALTLVETLATKPIEHVRLLRAATDENDEDTAGRYLDQVAARLRASGVQVSTQLKLAPPPEAITEAAAHVDLVILSTHGRGGFERWRHGSVASHAVAHLATPTLLVRVRPLATLMPGPMEQAARSGQQPAGV